jgi:hypothetical protein
MAKSSTSSNWGNLRPPYLVDPGPASLCPLRQVHNLLQGPSTILPGIFSDITDSPCSPYSLV